MFANIRAASGVRNPILVPDHRRLLRSALGDNPAARSRALEASLQGLCVLEYVESRNLVIKALA